jgi:integrase
MTATTDVKLWEVRRNKSSSTPSYEVRWVVAGNEKSRTRRTKALADSFLSDLRQATKRGESFDIATGLPESMLNETTSTTWYTYVLGYVDKRWPGAAASTRKSMLEALGTVTAALVYDRPHRPDFADLYRVLVRYALPPRSRAEERPSEVAKILRWLEFASVPVIALEDEDVVEWALSAIALRLDGKAVAATVARRKRAIFYNVLDMAATGKRRILARNPLDTMKKWKPPEVAEKVDRRVVANPRQARELLMALSYVGGRDQNRGRRLVAMFACMYYAALRPAEAVNLHKSDCELPDKGWGRFYLSRTTPEVGKRYTDSGELHDSKGLKHRPDDEVRPVPIPPELIEILRWHMAEFGVAPDGRLFRQPNGGVVGSSTYAQVWRAAREIALTPDQVVSPLAGRPYDLRHAAVSLWLNAGVPAPTVARRAGHSVDVLLRVYANCIDGDEEIANQRIGTALD